VIHRGKRKEKEGEEEGEKEREKGGEEREMFLNLTSVI